MPSVFPRDPALDRTLESEARLTLILVGIGLGVLVFATIVIFLGYRLLGFFRFSVRQSSQIVNTAENQKPAPTSDTPTDITMPSAQAPAAGPNPYSLVSRIPTMFASIRKHPSAPHRSMGLYNGLDKSPFPRPPAVGLESKSAQPNTRNIPVSPQGIVTPHTAEWMKVADAVVGRHPDAKPLHTRVATQADIDLISGHLHMPWAYSGKARSQPIPVKVLKPDAASPAPVFPPVKPEVLKDVGNTRGRVVLISVNKSAKRSPKGKSARRAHGKENLPAAPSSLPLFGSRALRS